MAEGMFLSEGRISAEAQGCHSPSLETLENRGDGGQKGERGDSGWGPGFHHLGEKCPLSDWSADPASSRCSLHFHTRATSSLVTVDAQAGNLAQAGTFISGQVSASFPGNVNKPRPWLEGSRASQMPQCPKLLSHVWETASPPTPTSGAA